MSELRKLRDAAMADVPLRQDRTMHDAIASTFGDKSADYVIHLLNNADKYAGMEERIAELEGEVDALCEDIDTHRETINHYLIENTRLREQLEASQGALREQMKARRDACARLEAVEERYFDLIMCVSRKFPGELRHDTAKRYITESETATCDGQAKAALQGDGGQE